MFFYVWRLYKRLGDKGHRVPGIISQTLAVVVISFNLWAHLVHHVSPHSLQFEFLIAGGVVIIDLFAEIVAIFLYWGFLRNHFKGPSDTR